MTLNDFDTWANAFLKKENFSADPSLNGIQIQNKEPGQKQIKKIAFAVDACEAAAKEAIKAGADVLFVHHGFLWGQCQTITGQFYNRITTFTNNDLALVAYHIPLDANEETGNNFGIARQLGLTEIEYCTFWRGMPVGVKGKLSSPLTIDELAKKVMRPGKLPNAVLPLGKKEITTVGICSGSASDDIETAISLGLDAFITGEVSHEQYHTAKEGCINVIGGGHYETETVGVNLVRQKVEKELGLETVFIDLPTGL